MPVTHGFVLAPRDIVDYKCNSFSAKKNLTKGLIQFKNGLYCVFLMLVRVLQFLVLMSLPLNSLSSVHFRIMLLINRQHRLDPLMTGANHWHILCFIFMFL